MTIRVLIVDDHQLIRQGVCALLSKAHDIQIVGEARDGLEALNAAEHLNPDVILMDVEMPRLDGLRTTEWLAAKGSKAKVLILSMKSGEQTIRQAYQSKVAGYLLKDSNREELIAAIRSVFAGQRVCSPEVVEYFH